MGRARMPYVVGSFFMELVPFLSAYLLTVITLVILYLWYLDRCSMNDERNQFMQEQHSLQENWMTERKDLYDRIMAPSFVEYKDNTETKEPTPEPETVVDLDQAQDEIMGVEEGEEDGSY